MDELYLAVPSPAYKEQVMAFKAEMLEHADSFDGCSGLNEVDTYEEWLDFHGREARKGWVPSRTWVTVRRSDGRVVGIVNFRTPLTEFLLQFGGHIGYCIRPADLRPRYRVGKNHSCQRRCAGKRGGGCSGPWEERDHPPLLDYHRIMREPHE